MEEIIRQMGLALLLTVAIETVTALLLKVRSIYDLIFIALVNCITNPAVNVIYISVMNLSGISSGSVAEIVLITVLEAAVWGIETLSFMKLLEYKKMRYSLLSLILNLSSFIMGLVIL